MTMSPYLARRQARLAVEELEREIVFGFVVSTILLVVGSWRYFMVVGASDLVSIALGNRRHEDGRGRGHSRHRADLGEILRFEVTGPTRPVQGHGCRVVGASFRHEQDMGSEAVQLTFHSLAISLLK